MNINLPSSVQYAIQALNDAGFEAYAVGGCVRDSLLGKQPDDWDITTSALPNEIQTTFANHRMLDCGIKHGTVTVFVEDVPLEITTYRIDGTYSDGRRPDHVTFTHSLTEDLRRRDFTVNAMAYHPCDGLIDPFNGQKDLKRHTIRCVGKAKKRFEEDALRILRALRFSSTLGFPIALNTALALRRLAPTLSCVAIERVAIELTKLLCGNNAQTVLRRYADVLSVILPDIDFAKSSHILATVPAEPLARFTALMVDCAPDQVPELCKQLRLSKKMTKDIVAVVEHCRMPLEPTRHDVLYALHALGPELLEHLLALRAVIDSHNYDEFRSIYRQLLANGDVCYRISDLAVNGDDLLSVGITDGKAVGATLAHLLYAVMDGICPNQKDYLLEYATKKPVQ